MYKLVLAFVFLTCMFAGLCLPSKIVSSPVITLAVLRETKGWTPARIKNMISRVSCMYDFPEKELYNLALAESSFRYDVKGDGGKATGLFQYHKQTWIAFQKKYNLKGFNIKDPVDQTVTTIHALSDNQHCNWSPLRKSYKCL